MENYNNSCHEIQKLFAAGKLGTPPQGQDPQSSESVFAFFKSEVLRAMHALKQARELIQTAHDKIKDGTVARLEDYGRSLADSPAGFREDQQLRLNVEILLDEMSMREAQELNFNETQTKRYVDTMRVARRIDLDLLSFLLRRPGFKETARIATEIGPRDCPRNFTPGLNR
ncbi:MAG: hypothetical protein V1763_02655 [Parcubacteria group bacterium]